MNDQLHLAPHLDPDTLSAFAEGALPAYERASTLAHLAVCPDCRDLLQLAQPQQEELQVVAVVPARHGWRWLWTSVAACAGVGLAAVLLSHPGKPVSAPPPPQPMARAESLPAPVASMLEQAPVARKISPPRAVPAPVQKPAPAVVFAAPSIAPPQPPSPQANTVHGELRQSQPYLSSGQALGSPEEGAAANQVAPQPARPASPVASAPRPPDPVQLEQLLGSAPAPASAPRALARQAPVNAAPPMQAVQRSASDFSQLVQPQAPSHLAEVSRYQQGSRIVVADTAGNVYFSPDKGGTWILVPPTWQGRVLSVGSPSSLPESENAVSAGTTKKAKKQLKAAFALLTTTGERWFSSDGRTWSR